MKYEECILEDGKKCDDCGKCDCCDLDPFKICDNCGKCLDDADYNGTIITGIEH